MLRGSTVLVPFRAPARCALLLSMLVGPPALSAPEGSEPSTHPADAPSENGPSQGTLASVLPQLEFPGPEREHFEIPLELWDRVLTRIGSGEERIGYDAEEMDVYGGDLFLLPAVRQLFANVRTLPRFSGELSDALLSQAARTAAFGYGWEEGGLGETVWRAYRLLGTSTGRRLMPDTLDVATAPFPLEGAVGTKWNALPEEVRELVVALYLAAEETQPWLQSAFDEDLLDRIVSSAVIEGSPGEDAVPPTRILYGVAMGHQEEAFDLLATPNRDVFRLYESVDLAYLGFATVLWCRYVELALQRFHEAGGPERLRGADIDGFVVATPLGEIVLGGTGNDRHELPRTHLPSGAADASPRADLATATEPSETRDPADAPLLVLDLGGDDEYGPGLGTPSRLDLPISVIIDLSGNDRYVDPAATDEDVTGPPSFGAGIFGIGALLDLSGDDEYQVDESGLGRGCFGTGLLLDFGGNDRYFGGERWNQGAAHAGFGFLLDLAGNDEYSCAEQSQGMGGTLGVGLLLDRAGDDRYIARDDGNISELYLGQSVAMSQGCGFGRRADLGDGHSLAGGFGLLVDGEGDDDYHAQVWAQGCGYWWGVGLLEDRTGNDRYRNGKYSSGAAAHFAIGLHVDLEGDDVYNQGNDAAKNQFQGHARDGSIGVFLDGDGDDQYEFRSHCAGSGDLASVGLFWDRRGRDRYVYVNADSVADDWTTTPPLGSTTRYGTLRSFRDDLPVYGIFLDTGGSDRYDTGGIGADDSVWTQHRYDRAWGVGIDRELWTR